MDDVLAEAVLDGAPETTLPKGSGDVSVPVFPIRGASCGLCRRVAAVRGEGEPSVRRDIRDWSGCMGPSLAGCPSSR